MNTTCTTCQGSGIVDESGQGHYERCSDCWGTGLSQWPRPTRLQGVEPRKYRETPTPPRSKASWIEKPLNGDAVLWGAFAAAMVWAGAVLLVAML